MSMPSARSALYTSSAERWRTLLASNSSRILRRGRVAFSPLSLRLWAVLIDYHYRPMSRTAILILAAALPGCGVPRIPGVTPYKMVVQLKAGMSKDQVRSTLGTPLLIDIFHGERCDYIYSRELPNGAREQRKLVVFFEDGKLVRVDGDVVPAG